MLTGLKENGQVKATRYWPSRVNLQEEYANIKIKFVEEDKRDDICIRKLELWKDDVDSDESFEIVSDSEVSDHNSNDFLTMSTFMEEIPRSENAEVKIVYQVHCMKWEDFGVPDTSSYMLKLIDLYEEKKPINELDPVIVHCSAGVGRTGTFIAIAEAIHRYKAGHDVDIEQIVADMRSQRTGMVQTPDQYQFIYKAVSEYIDHHRS